jgi:hypothetical protein
MISGLDIKSYQLNLSGKNSEKLQECFMHLHDYEIYLRFVRCLRILEGKYLCKDELV